MVRTIDDVIGRMQSIADSVGPHDGVGWFNTVYQRVTEAIRDRLGAGFFSDGAFVEQFVIVFADMYFAAIDADAAGRRVSAAWRPLFVQRADRRVHPVQFVLAGMNAHINHDLALAVVDACLAAHTHPLAGTIPDDYRKINEVLAEIESKIRRPLLDDLEREFLDRSEPLLHLLTSWSLVQAREAAWVRAQVLWLLRADRPLFDQLVVISASTTGMTGRQLLTPLLPASR